MNHHEYTKQVNPVVPCAAWHLTFEGRCLNCGYDPKGFHNPLVVAPKLGLKTTRANLKARQAVKHP